MIDLLLQGIVFLEGIVPEQAARILLDSLFNGALLLAVATLSTTALRKSPAGVRHQIWALALVAVFLQPMLVACLPGWSLVRINLDLPEPLSSALVTSTAEPVGSARRTAEPAAGTPLADSNLLATMAPNGTSTMTEPNSLAPTPSRTPARSITLTSLWAPFVLGIWAAGLVLITGWQLLCLAGVWWMARRGQDLRDPAWTDTAARVSRLQGLEQPIRLVAHPRVPVPLVWGFHNPTLLLPADAEKWAPNVQELVLHHELAHIRRRDHLTLLLAQFSCALHWVNPLVWLAANRLAMERERSCDDAVLAAGARASDYARQLLNFGRRLSWPALAAPRLALARPSQLRGRIQAILDPRQQREIPGRMTRATIMVLCLGIALPLAAVKIRAQSPTEPQATSTETTRESILETLEAIEDPGIQTLANAIRHQTWKARHAHGGTSKPLTDQRAVEPLIAALTDPEPVIRQLAAWGLGELRAAQAIEPLRLRLADNDMQVRRQAAQSLGDIGRDEPVADLVLLLTHKDRGVRLRTAHALGDIQDPSALPALAAALEDPATAVQEKADWAIRQIIEEMNLDQVVELLSSDTAVARWHAAHVLGDRQIHSAVEALSKALSDADAGVRAKVAWALGELQDEAAIQALLRVANNETESLPVRTSAVRGLGEIGSDAVVKDLVNLLRSPDWQVRSQAADALGDIGDQAALQPLTASLQDHHGEVRANARRSLNRIR